MASKNLLNHQSGIDAVAGAALISIVASGGLLCYLGYSHYISARRTKNHGRRQGLRFVKSQFALLLVDLLIADLVQALGFVLNFAHLAQPTIQPSSLCTTQAVLIQLGDVAASLSALAIAGHTYCLLAKRTTPSALVLTSVVGIKWLFVILLAAVGPIAFSGAERGPFYAAAGGWCWISNAYPAPRFYLHYGILFASGAGSIILYGLVAVSLRRRLRCHPVISSDEESSQEEKMAEYAKIKRAAKTMLLYPLCYIALLMPLASLRVASMLGHEWSTATQLAAGAIFTLAGAVDAVVFGITRGLFFTIPSKTIATRPMVDNEKSTFNPVIVSLQPSAQINEKISSYPTLSFSPPTPILPPLAIRPSSPSLRTCEYPPVTPPRRSYVSGRSNSDSPHSYGDSPSGCSDAQSSNGGDSPTRPLFYNRGNNTRGL